MNQPYPYLMKRGDETVAGRKMEGMQVDEQVGS
jgi:hypothetical protein